MVVWTEKKSRPRLLEKTNLSEDLDLCLTRLRRKPNIMFTHNVIYVEL